MLICEDDALIRLNTADMLRGSRHDGDRGGAPGRGAGERSTARRPDVFVIDVGLPDMSGIDLARRIREVLPAAPLVFATGHVEVPGIEGMAGVETVRKPYDEHDLRASIARLTG